MTKEFALSLVFCACLQASAGAQNPRGQGSIEGREIQFWLMDQEREQSLIAPRIAEREHAEFLQQQFLLKAKKFVELWEEVARDFNNKRAFNVQKAKALSKAFRELEQTGAWPKPDAASHK